mmetsp:Transcript_31399/g.63821  ORF Transcript_31399/g.63821 Transcript_31399/m.63821 type:complete len:522 (+) Transcript_31399:313-1878(+)
MTVTSLLRLSSFSIPQLAERKKVSVPKYDRTQVQAGILHIGVGNFHRAHMAAYMDDLMNDDFDSHREWGIVGAGILSFDAEKREKLASQDWLQTLVQRDADSVQARIIGSMTNFLPVDFELRQHTALQEAMEQPSIKIVSLTVTEGGYFLHNGDFDPQHPDMEYDIYNPGTPTTVFGMMVKALDRRRKAGIPPFSVMSCDNIPHNGNVVRSVVVGLANHTDRELAKWIDENVAFPNSMVDRITPGTTAEQSEYIKNEYGYEDASAIFCEPFRQWILEDKFPHGRPKLENLEGFKFVSDVAPYEHMKIRILNGGHASLCYPAALLGVQYVHEAMQHPVIATFLDTLERNEIIPTVGPVPDTDLHDYWQLIAKRFSNPTIQDTIGRVCFGGASNQPKFIVPVARDALQSGSTKVDGLALVSAMWCRYCQGQTESGETIRPNDPQWERLQLVAEQAIKDPAAWLRMTAVYGEIGDHAVFVKSFCHALETIETEGVEVAMKKYVEVTNKKAFDSDDVLDASPARE